MLNLSRRAHAPTLVLTAAALTTLSGCASGLDSVRGEPAFAVIDGQRAPVPDIDMGDKAILARFYEEGTENSQVLDLLTHLCVDIGPRLTGSDNSVEAERWAVNSLTEWGLDAARREPWGQIASQFNRGNASAQVVALPAEDDDEDEGPTVVRDLAFTTLAWTRGTEGPVTGHVVRMPETLAEVDKLGSELTGAWMLVPPLYGDRRGVRSVGFQMRERSDLRHTIRTGEFDPFSPEAMQADDDTAETPTNQPGSTTWAGSMSYRGSPLPATLTLVRNDEGTITEGTFAIEQFHDGPIEDIDETTTEDGTALAFGWPNPMGRSSVALTLENGTLTGSSGDGDFPITLSAANPDGTPIEDEPVITETPEQVLAHVLERDPAGFISTSKDDRVWTTRTTGWKQAPVEDLPTDVEINITGPDYYYVNSMLADGQDVHVRADLPHTVQPGPITCYNVIADITGTDLPDEVVIISAHLDSWDGPGSQGTVDNGTGVAVMLEAARILAATNAKPKRTIRLILWTGEEQGLWGAREYVDQLNLAERANISVMLNDDGGTNYQGGFPAASNMVPMLAAATAPTNGLFFSDVDHERMLNDDNPDNDDMAGYMNVNIRDTGRNLRTHRGSDHAAFNDVGIPGLYTDEVGRADYRFAWHTQRDNIDQAIEEYLIQSAVNTAITAYRLANAPTLLPRDPGPEEDGENTAMAP